MHSPSGLRRLRHGRDAQLDRRRREQRRALGARRTLLARALELPEAEPDARDRGTQRKDRDDDPARAQAQLPGLGAGGSIWNATTVDWKPQVLCVESQNGFLLDWPQRQSEIFVRPASPNALPSWSTISKSPSTRIEPLLMIASRLAAMGSSGSSRVTCGLAP